MTPDNTDLIAEARGRVRYLISHFAPTDDSDTAKDIDLIERLADALSQPAPVVGSGLGNGTADLETPYVPTPTYFADQDAIEFVERDAVVVMRQMSPDWALLLDMATREPIGFRLEAASRIGEIAAPPSSRSPGATAPDDGLLYPAHQDTFRMLQAFSRALGDKLAQAEIKYGFGNEWSTDDWEDKCRADLREHMAKGDPLDVAAYAAFCWARGWSTAAPSHSPAPVEVDGWDQPTISASGLQVCLDFSSYAGRDAAMEFLVELYGEERDWAAILDRGPVIGRQEVAERIQNILDAKITTKGNGDQRQAECYACAQEIAALVEEGKDG